MPEYTCNICQYKTKIKTHYNNHLKTKKHARNCIKKTKNEVPNNTCEYCNQKFSRVCNMYRHKKYYCKVKFSGLVEHIESIDKDIANFKKKYSYEEPTVTNNTQINNNQQVIINNINNNYTNNLLSYTNTDTTHLTLDQYKKIFNRRNNCIQEAIKAIHFDANKPENMNIYISNLNNGYVLVYDGDDWILKDKEIAIEELMDSKEILLEEWMDEYQDKYPELKEKFDYYLNSKLDGQLAAQMKKEIELYLYNNKKGPESKRKNMKKQITNG